MSDAKLVKRLSTATVDFSISEDGDIENANFFDSLIAVALFEESRATESEISAPELRRGWIGNESTPGFERGSKIWLYEQQRLTRTAMNGIIAAANESLTRIVTNGFAKQITTSVDIDGTAVVLEVKIKRINDKVDTRYFELWNNSGVTAISGV